MNETKHTLKQPAAVDGPDSQAVEVEALEELEELAEAARLLGVTQARRGFGCYTDEDRRFERAMRESVAKHRAALCELLAKVERLRAGRGSREQTAHPAITHCDNCGCDWLDNGLNPVGCPYCKQHAQTAEIRALWAERDALHEALAELITWIPSADTFLRMGFDPATPMRALKRAKLALGRTER